MKLFHLLLMATFLLIHTEISAKVIQILHTNDLHSYFQGTRGGIGGYAQLKKVLDELRAEGDQQGIPTLHFDGGDFGEGSSFYFSNHGVDSLRALDKLGVDVTVLGNHDFILGGGELKRQILAAKLKAKMVSANIIGKTFMGLKTLLPNHVDYNIDGLKLRVFGLTTNEIHYMYPLRPLGFITDPHKAGIKEAKKARKNDVDFTIALTHIGLEYDIGLVTKSRTIDMVIGGHSHILLPRPQMTRNLEGRQVPIVQAGAHSGYVGAMLIDLKGKGKAEILDYRIVNIMKDMAKDDEMKKFVEEAYVNRERYFGRKWEEVIGLSEITLSGNFNGRDTQGLTCWSRHMARLTRQVAKTELGLQFDVFQGEQINPGPITFGDIIDNFPHFRAWGDKGWKVARSTISGFALKNILKLMAESELGLQVMIDGVKVKDKNSGGLVIWDPKIHSPEDAIINGDDLSNLRFYSIGLPSEVPYAMLKLANVLTFAVLHNMRIIKNGDYWPLLENYIKNNSPLKCLEN
jgi:2',3'-cyclic-nucleotide 2'-phosphodiesterase (5'-nucleotidase family)